MTITIKRIALLTTLLAAFVVALGAYTRLKDAGLGCPDWPGCYGFLTVPENAHEIAIAEARFPGAPVEIEKGWPEMVHRYFASTLGLLIVIQAGLCFSYYRRNTRQDSKPTNADRPPLKLPLFLVLLVICQGLFGMWTVTLKLWPQVVSGHLLGGFATLSLLFLHAVRVHNYKLNHPPSSALTPSTDKSFGQTNAVSGMLKWTLLGLLLVVGQIFLGAWTASNYASVACTDFPTCQGQWWPEMNFESGFNLTQSIGPNYLGGLMDGESRVAIHVTHRIGALALSIYLLCMLWRVWRVSEITLRKPVLLVLAALTLQVVLGIINVLWLIPLPIAVAHNAGGALLLMTMVYLNYRLFLSHSLKAITNTINIDTTTKTKITTPHFDKNVEAIS